MSLKEKIAHFKRQSTKVKLLTAAFLSLAYTLILVLVLSLLEYTFWFDSMTRTVLFYFSLALLIFLVVFVLIPPFLLLTGLKKPSEDQSTAKDISDRLPELNDSLINFLQLEKESENELAQASASQKAHGLQKFDFLQAIDLTKYRRFGKMLGGVVLLFFAILLFNGPILSSGAQRLVFHSKEFIRPAPFQFVLINDSLNLFQGQSIEIKLKLVGDNIPEEVNIITETGEKSMTPVRNGEFNYLIQKPTKSHGFYFESAGFTSESHKLTILNKPTLNIMTIELDYPDYLGIANQTITNGGNISAPSGTKAKWRLQSNYTDRALAIIGNDTVLARRVDENHFEFEKKLLTSGNYTIQLQNAHAINESILSYSFNIAADESPAIEVSFLPDTASYKYLIVTGNISDDYGFHSLSLHLEIDGKKFIRPLILNKGLKNQGFYAEWMLDSIVIRPNQDVVVYALVRDNDVIHGYKPAKSAVYYFKKPSLSELSDAIDQKSKSTESQMEKSMAEMKALQKSLEELAKKLKSQNKIGWQEEKLIEESLEQRKELEKMLSELKEKHDDLLKANDNFQQSSAIKEKSEELNKLIEDLMDDTTKQLYDELQKLLQEKNSTDDIKNKLNQINRQENRMMKDLERTKELFKRLKMESGLERVSQQLDSLAKQQQKLSEQPLDSGSLDEQKDVENQFEELKEDLDEIEKLNQELDRPEPLGDMSLDEREISQEMQQVKESMKAGDQTQSKKSQQKVAQKMKEMGKRMQNMQAGMEMEVMQENIENLRKIMDDLIRLSYRQEELLSSFKTVNLSDPRFIELSQNQIRLKENLVIIEDSLRSLATRVVQLSSFITKEVDDIDLHMAASVEQIKERQRGRAVAHQQFSMTSMNNLALLLDDVLQQMQMTMSESMGKGKGKPQNMPIPGLGEMQKQLSEQIKRLGQEGKSGRELSEELARMAAEQEMIRQQLEELQNKLNGQFGNDQISDDLSKAIKMMEDNETDLVNKRLTQQLMERQKEITTRLLEAENALKEQQKDPEREGESAQQRERLFPPKFQEYLNERKKEIELLRTVPIDLNPFYKKEVNDYFRRLSEKN